MDAPASIPRPPDLVLARLHLRLGSLALARAELETLAGRDALDEGGLVDLAEARWRTGDIAGAGEAAVAALTDEEGPLLALVVAAEAAAARGRPTEARRLAGKAMAEASGSIDEIFAGMPRGSAWPPDASAPPPAPTTMFDAPRRGGVAVPHSPRHGRVLPRAADVPLVRADEPTPSDAADAGTDGLWGDDGVADVTDAGVLSADLAAEAEAEAEVGLTGATDEFDPADELDRGRAALAADDVDQAAVRLALVLRMSPPLAPAVLDLVVDRSEPGLAIVRGDAYRLVGRELDARRAFADAARSVAVTPPPAVTAAPDAPDPDSADPDPDPDDPPPQGDPA
jgi:hypothetical protein